MGVSISPVLILGIGAGPPRVMVPPVRRLRGSGKILSEDDGWGLMLPSGPTSAYAPAMLLDCMSGALAMGSSVSGLPDQAEQPTSKKTAGIITIYPHICFIVIASSSRSSGVSCILYHKLRDASFALGNYIGSRLSLTRLPLPPFSNK